MKKLIAILAVLGTFSILEATSIPIAENAMTITTVKVSSYTATAVPATASLMKNRTVMYLQNIDTTYNIFCATYVVTSTNTNTFMIPKGGTPIRLDMRGFTFYCLTDGDVVASTISVLQAY